MVPKGYKEVRAGVYESDAFITSSPKIDSARIRQILNNQRPAPAKAADTGASLWGAEPAARETNERNGA